MNIYTGLLERVLKIIDKLGLEGKDGQTLDLTRITIEPPRDAAHGDLAVNAALILAKQVGAPPRELAQKIADQLLSDEDIDGIDIAGPGFINIRFAAKFWQTHLREILSAGCDYGREPAGSGDKVNVEYVSANPTGPMHVGHIRGAVVGDVLANLLEFCGHQVVREYYVNDAGAQIDVLAKSVLLRYREALGEEIGDVPEGLYPGEYLIPLGQALKDEFGEELLSKPEDEVLQLIKSRTIDAMMQIIRDDLAALNVHHEVFFSERTLHADNAKRIRGAINQLTLEGHVYKGTLPPPKGEVPADWEDREQTLFRSTEVGDDSDRALIKSNGSYTYFAADLAYFHDKMNRGFEKTIFVLGADHSGYVKRLKAMAKAISGDRVELTVVLCNLVKLLKDGQLVKMGKRTGNMVTLRDVVSEVGVDPVRYMMLYRKSEAPLDFDFARVTEKSKDNPVFYVQYAIARCHSIARQAHEQMGIGTDQRAEFQTHLHLLEDAGELQLVAAMARFPKLVASAAQTLEPHRLAFYLYELASSFHAHWQRGNSEPDLRFVKLNERELTLARLGLAAAVCDVLTAGMKIIGADAPEEMR